MTQKQLLDKYFPLHKEINYLIIPRAIIEHGQEIISYVLIQKKDREPCEWMAVVTKTIYNKRTNQYNGLAEVVREKFKTFDAAIEGAMQLANAEVYRINDVMLERGRARKKEDEEWKALEEYEKVLDSKA